MTISGGRGKTLVLGLVGRRFLDWALRRGLLGQGLGGGWGENTTFRRSFIAWVLGGRDRSGDWFGHFGQKGVLL